MDVRKLIKYHVFLSESILECYKSLRECFGTYAPSYETVRRWANTIKNGWEETMPLAVEHQHRRRMNATWKKWNLSLNARAVFHARQLLKKSESLQQVFTVSSPTARGNEKFVHTCAQPWANSQACSSCHHPYAALQKLSQCIPRSHFNVSRVMDTFIWPLAEKKKMNGVPKCYRGRKLHGAVRILWKSCTPCISAEMDFFLTIPCQYVRQSTANITAHSCSITWGGLFAVNNQKCLSVVAFCSMTMQHRIAIVMCKIWCNSGAGRCWHIHPTLQISPHVITGYLHVWKNIFRVNDMNRNTISTLLSLPIYIVWVRMNTKLQRIVYNIGGKSILPVLVITLTAGNTCKLHWL